MSTNRYEASAHANHLVIEKSSLLVEKVQLESRLVVVPIKEIVVEHCEKFEDFVDASIKVMKIEISTFFELVVDDVKDIDPNFPLGKVHYLHDFT